MENLTDLEEQLAGPAGHQLQAELIARAQDLEAGWRARLAAGLTRADFTLYQAAANAAASAQQVLRQWPVAQPQDHPPLPLPGGSGSYPLPKGDNHGS